MTMLTKCTNNNIIRFSVVFIIIASNARRITYLNNVNKLFKIGYKYLYILHTVCMYVV